MMKCTGSMLQTGIDSIHELLDYSDQLLYNKKREKKKKACKLQLPFC